MDNLRRHAQQQVCRYLEIFPSESAHLLALQVQLNTDVNDVFHRSNSQGHITTSALVLDAVFDKVLVIEHRALGRILQPGGHQEGGVPLWESSQREALEETGVVTRLHGWHIDLNAPFDIDTHPIPARPEKNEVGHVHHDFVYLFSADARVELALQLAEVTSAHWIDRRQFARLPGERFMRLGSKLDVVAATWLDC